MNQGIQIYYFVNVDHNNMAAHLIRSDSEGCYELLYTQWDGNNYYGCGTAVRKMGMLGVSSLKMKLTLKLERVTLIGKGR